MTTAPDCSTEGRRCRWFLAATLDKYCSADTRCQECRPDGDCDKCDSIEGRWIQAVCEYASTCDVCGELTSHVCFAFVDEETDLGCCEACFEKGQLPPNPPKPENPNIVG